MQRARWVAVALLLAGAATTALGVSLLPEFGEAGVVALRGPARVHAGQDGARYAVFMVGHWHGGPAFVLAEGEVVPESARAWLRARDASAWDRVPVGPFEVGPSQYVREAYRGPFEVASPWTRVLPLLGGPLALLAGAASAFGERKAAMRVLAPGVLLAGLGAWAGGEGDGGVLAVLLLIVLALVGALLAAWRRARPWGLGLLLGGSLGVALALWTNAWFPSSPAV